MSALIADRIKAVAIALRAAHHRAGRARLTLGDTPAGHRKRNPRLLQTQRLPVVLKRSGLLQKAHAAKETIRSDLCTPAHTPILVPLRQFPIRCASRQRKSSNHYAKQPHDLFLLSPAAAYRPKPQAVQDLRRDSGALILRAPRPKFHAADAQSCGIRLPHLQQSSRCLISFIMGNQMLSRCNRYTILIVINRARLQTQHVVRRSTSEARRRGRLWCLGAVGRTPPRHETGDGSLSLPELVKTWL